MTESLIILDDDSKSVNKFRLSLVSLEELPVEKFSRRLESITNLIKLEHFTYSVPVLGTSVPRTVMSIGKHKNFT